jgi:hypothetical protein
LKGDLAGRRRNATPTLMAKNGGTPLALPPSFPGGVLEGP